MRAIKSRAANIVKKVGKKALDCLSIKPNLIVFDNFMGRGYGCNPKYIAEELKDDGLTLVWLVSDHVNDVFPKYIKPVKYGSIKAFYYLSRARVRITNVRNYTGLQKKKGQYYIQTWHGALGPKKVEKDAEEKLNAGYIKEAKINGRETDLMIANNALMEQLFKESFWYGGEVLRCGMPRNKPLFGPQDYYKNLIVKKYSLDDQALLCLYAPTFRNNWKLKDYLFDFKKCSYILQKRFKQDVIMLIRLHPNVAQLMQNANLDEAIDISDYADMQELLGGVDILISDYSSALEDFGITNRPAFAFTPDIEDYIEERGFYYELGSRPFPCSSTEAGLFDEIAAFDENEYLNDLHKFYERFDYRDDGQGATVVSDVVRKISKK